MLYMSKYKFRVYSVLTVFILSFFLFMALSGQNRLQATSLRAVRSSETRLNITILTVLSNASDTKDYQRAIDSVRCYSEIHGYNYLLVSDRDYTDRCTQKDKFFRRHCISAIHVQESDYLLFIDADIGVVNPNRKIEEFIDERFDITFYDRFFNAEVGMASYILKNSKEGIDFITEFANYENKLPKSFHGTDNGAIHAFLISKMFPDRQDEYRICLEMWNRTHNFGELFIYETCIRSMMGISEEYKNMRFIRKGAAWVRDNWLTNSLWSPETDFMIHLWKQRQLVSYEQKDLPIRFTTRNQYTWYDPIIGEFDFDRCIPGNTTWNYDLNLMSNKFEILNQYRKLHRSIQRENYSYLAKLVPKTSS